MSRLRLVFATVALAGCADGSRDITGVVPDRLSGVKALAAKSGGGSATFTYNMIGDIAANAPWTAREQRSNPFANLSTTATLTLGAPTGDITTCKEANPSQTFAVTFGAGTGTWTGSLSIPSSSNNVVFKATNAGQTMQFTMGDFTGGPTLTLAPDGSATYSYTNAALYFGALSIAHDGFYRCVNLTVTATPS